MTDLAVAEPDTAQSTTIDTDTATGPSGAGAPRTLGGDDKPAEKTPSLRDTIADVVKKDDEATEEATDKPPEPKPEKAKSEEAPAAPAKDVAKAAERAPDGKFVAKQSEGDDAKPDAKSEAKTNGHIEAPTKFLPDAKEVWRNVPRAVQRDVDNTLREHETELTKYREAAERYEPLRRFDEVVRQHGRAGLHETMAEVAQLEDLLAKNPVAALNQMLLRAGPRKADGQPYSLFELAQAVVNGGQDNYHKVVSQPAQQQSQQRGADPEVAQLRAQLARVQEQTMEATVIAPFRSANPRYDELRGDIAFFLQSDKIPTSLSAPDRLAAAYDMAVRINPSSHADEPETSARPDPDRRADEPSAAKSIKSAPGAVSDDMEPERGGSISELLRDEMKRARRS